MAAEKKDKQENGRDRVARENVRCRVCRMVDGYGAGEDECRFCGAKLFKGDAV